LERAKKLGPTVEVSRNACPTRVKLVTTLDESLAGRNLGPQSLTFGTLRIVVHGIGTLTSPIWNGGHLFVRIGDSVREDDRGEVDLAQTGNGSQGKFLVLPVEDCGGVGSVCSAITFRSHMEGCLGVFWEAREEQLEEGIHILSGCGATVDLGTIVGVGVSDVYRLVEEEDVAVCIPRVLVVRYVGFIGNLTRSQLK